MDMYITKRLNHHTRQLAPLMIVLALILGGCAMEKEITPKPKKDPFFDKWREKAKDSRGHSPTAKKRSVDLSEEVIPPLKKSRFLSMR